jgi:serine/threonine-protein kinase HipA
MMERELDVFVDVEGVPMRAGRLWARARGRNESASFEYDDGWLSHRKGFALDPLLPLGRGLFHTEQPLFNAFGDPAPDRWGQTLLRRNERARAKKEGRTPRTLLAVDFLTLVDDATRLGALRFREASSGDAFLSSSGKPVPPLLDLTRLLAATSRISANEETDADLALVLAPGTSLGGARPKASVRDVDGRLLIAKFPRKDDEWPLTRWEATTLALAARAKIHVCEARLQDVARRPVLLLARFDRDGTRRTPFMSALTLLGATETEGHSYVELAEALRREGAEVQRDLRELWRRMVFNIIVSNTDDHLRNHALLRAERGWRLSPAYDLNPMPVDVRPRVHALALDETEGDSSMEAALAVAPSFALPTVKEARAIAREVGEAVSAWRTIGAKHGLKKRDLDRMESAFEHEDLRAALR